ncbi:MAG: hypothetical protein WBN82_03485 [Porticoccaceae bacterium]
MLGALAGTVLPGFCQESTPTAAQQARTQFDTRLRGNGNLGHDFGTGLADADKAALLEYLKTL